MKSVIGVLSLRTNNIQNNSFGQVYGGRKTHSLEIFVYNCVHISFCIHTNIARFTNPRFFITSNLIVILFLKCTLIPHNISVCVVECDCQFESNTICSVLRSNGHCRRMQTIIKSQTKAYRAFNKIFHKVETLFQPQIVPTLKMSLKKNLQCCWIPFHMSNQFMRSC